jgi:hypothetical protein
MSAFDRAQGPEASRTTGSGARHAPPKPSVTSVADAVLTLQRTAGNRAVGATLARKVEMRDVGRGEQSGYARLPELIHRLNRLCPHVGFYMEGQQLTYVKSPTSDAAPTSFESQMMALIDQDPVLPMRLTNRQGLLGDRTHGFHTDVDGDAFTSGYVDIDDLLAGDDLGFQMLLVHFLIERAATRRYAQRLGTKFSDVEFQHGHSLGIEAEARILREYFNDPTIHIVQDSPSVMIRRLFQNSAGVSFRRRITIGTGEQRGIEASSVDVVTSDGTVYTPADYLAMLDFQAEHP